MKTTELPLAARPPNGVPWDWRKCYFKVGQRVTYRCFYGAFHARVEGYQVTTVGRVNYFVESLDGRLAGSRSIATLEELVPARAVMTWKPKRRRQR